MEMESHATTDNDLRMCHFLSDIRSFCNVFYANFAMIHFVMVTCMNKTNPSIYVMHSDLFAKSGVTHTHIINDE